MQFYTKTSDKNDDNLVSLWKKYRGDSKQASHIEFVFKLLQEIFFSPAHHSLIPALSAFVEIVAQDPLYRSVFFASAEEFICGIKSTSSSHLSVVYVLKAVLECAALAPLALAQFKTILLYFVAYIQLTAPHFSQKDDASLTPFVEECEKSLKVMYAFLLLAEDDLKKTAKAMLASLAGRLFSLSFSVFYHSSKLQWV